MPRRACALSMKRHAANQISEWGGLHGRLFDMGA
jgi:hypothetical protein